MLRSRLALALVLVSCGGNDRSVIDHTGRLSFALGGACCDDATFATKPVEPSLDDPDALAMLAAGVTMWRPKRPLDFELCGVRTRTERIDLGVFRKRLAQVQVSCSGDGCPGMDCASIIAACTQQLGAPQRHEKRQDIELVRFTGFSTFINIVSGAPAYCEVSLQDSSSIVELEAAMAAANK